MKIDGRIVELVAVNVPKRPQAPRPRIYDEPVVKTLHMMWESFDYMCGQRLAVFLREVLPVLVGSGEVHCSETTYKKLLEISPATIDRLLREAKRKLQVRGTTHTKAVGILKAQIPIRTWSEVAAPEPGHFQIDLVGHDGGNPRGQFAYSLDAIDLYSGWVEPRALQNRAHRWTLEAVQDISVIAPMPMKSIHLRQRWGVHQRAIADLVPIEPDTTLSFPSLQEKRYLFCRAEELQRHTASRWLRPV